MFDKRNYLFPLAQAVQTADSPGMKISALLYRTLYKTAFIYWRRNPSQSNDSFHKKESIWVDRQCICWTWKKCLFNYYSLNVTVQKRKSTREIEVHSVDTIKVGVFCTSFLYSYPLPRMQILQMEQKSIIFLKFSVEKKILRFLKTFHLFLNKFEYSFFVLLWIFKIMNVSLNRISP